MILRRYEMRWLETSRKLVIHCCRISSGRVSTRCSARSNVPSLTADMLSVVSSKACNSSKMAARARRAFALYSCPDRVSLKAEKCIVAKDSRSGSHFVTTTSFIPVTGDCELLSRNHELLSMVTISGAKDVVDDGSETLNAVALMM